MAGRPEATKKAEEPKAAPPVVVPSVEEKLKAVPERAPAEAAQQATEQARASLERCFNSVMQHYTEDKIECGRIARRDKYQLYDLYQKTRRG